MNSAEIKEISLAYNELFKSTKKFEEFKSSLESNRENDSFNKEQIESIVESFRQRLEAIAKFEKELDKFEKFLSPGIFKNLKDALINEKAILGRIGADAAGYLELNDSMYLESLLSSFDSEKDISKAFNNELDSFATDLGFNLFKQALDEQISLEDLKLMAVAFESDSALHDRITHVIDIVEKRNAEKVREIEEAEKAAAAQPLNNGEEVAEGQAVVTEPAVAHTDTAASANPSGDSEQVQEPIKPTLEEKIAAVNYQQGMNINAAVQEITLESKLEEIAAEIAQLQSKEKLTVRDKFKLRQLMEQQLAFEAYGESLEEQKVSGKERRRNKKLSSTVDKIDEKTDALEESMERSQDYTSKTMRFLSCRYQNKLNTQLQALREKQGTLTNMQKASAVARFDKKTKKLMRKAKRKGTIEQLKAYKDSLVQELQNIGHDVIRFFSTKEEDMEVLTDSVIIMPDNIISLEERRRALTHGSMAA